MSRIGNKLIEIPEKVKISANDRQVVVDGPKGKLEWELPSTIDLKQEDESVQHVPRHLLGGGAQVDLVEVERRHRDLAETLLLRRLWSSEQRERETGVGAAQGSTYRSHVIVVCNCGPQAPLSARGTARDSSRV